MFDREDRLNAAIGGHEQFDLRAQFPARRAKRCTKKSIDARPLARAVLKYIAPSVLIMSALRVLAVVESPLLSDPLVREAARHAPAAVGAMTMALLLSWFLSAPRIEEMN